MKINSFMVLVFLLVVVFGLSGPQFAFCNESAPQKKTTEELTKSFKDKGWAELSFEAAGLNVVIIYHKGFKQNETLADGALVGILGVILTPEVIFKLKNSGFTEGILIDGKYRDYPFEISNKYYDELETYFKRISGDK